MPIYLVRWPDLSCSLVRADSRIRLLDILDELADPSGVQVWPYEGPLFIDITLPAQVSVRKDPERAPDRPLTPDDIVIGEVDGIALIEEPKVEFAGCDTGADTKDAIMAQAFPHLHEVLYQNAQFDDVGRLVVDSEAVRDAVREEAMQMVVASWRDASVLRSDDPDAAIAAQMGTSVEWIKILRAGLEAEDDDGVPF